MKVKCEYCDSFIDDTLDKCPNCGAPNEHMMRSANKVPKTIEELKEFCAQKNINLQQMHVHIGENYTGPKAFGIYKDGENFVVYKNKANGERAVRYRGTDESYAVNELYQKMKEMTTEAKAGKTVRSANIPNRKTRKKKSNKFWIFLAVIIAFIFLVKVFGSSSPSNGYYSYQGNEYCYDNDGWYMYGANGWSSVDVDDFFGENYGDYADYDYSGDLYNGNSGWDWGNDNDYNNNWDWNNDDDWDDDDWADDWDDDWDFDGGDWDSDW